VVEQEYSCMAAGDFMRVLALYSDDAILNSRFLSRVGTSMATPDLRTPTPVDERYLPHQTRGLFHARLLPDGRIAAVSPIGEAGLPLLYLFVRNGDQWQIDDIELMGSGYASAGVERNAYTGSEFVFSGTIRYVTYGWGLEWGPEWTPVSDQEHTTIDVAILTNGVSLVAVGFPGSAPESGPASCVHPTPEDLAARFKSAGLKDVAKAVKQGLTPVNATDGTPLQGAGEDRAFEVYALASPIEGRIPSGGAQWVYIECRTMADGAWILGVTQLVPAANYEAEAARRDELMASLEDWDPSR